MPYDTHSHTRLHTATQQQRNNPTPPPTLQPTPNEPSSPSHSNSSSLSSADTLPLAAREASLVSVASDASIASNIRDTLNLDHNDSNASPQAERPKRCKISREQLALLVRSFELEPLPNFEQRQQLAKRLDMAPRSVQIWFQNRRQRLKPQALRKSASNKALATSDGGGGDDGCMAAVHMGDYRPPPGILDRSSASPGHGMPGLAAAASASLLSDLLNGIPLQNSTAKAAYLAALQAEHSQHMDVMEPFAATKAMLGAGYQPPSAHSLAYQRHVGTSAFESCSELLSGYSAPADSHDQNPPADGLLLLLECAGARDVPPTPSQSSVM